MICYKQEKRFSRVRYNRLCSNYTQNRGRIFVQVQKNNRSASRWKSVWTGWMAW